MTSNRLINETSPYLLQHAHNPVDWYPWGNEALRKATEENKPILVSIGYSACHWCHVMERESFENEAVAQVMNAHFVCIKVDREERPDVDAVYMDAVQAMGVRGGWPLNVFLMPNAKPFYGLTYLPPQNWVQLLKSVRDGFENHYEDLSRSADGFADNMQLLETQKYSLSTDSESFTIADAEAMFAQLEANFDLEKGGMNRAPKFMMPSIYKFLLRYIALTKSPQALTHLKLSLDRIALGGIYDHLGGGWARYSVDDEWFIPHFEKMLYDNGQLLSVYSEAYVLTNSELYKKRVYETVAWLRREMTSPAGGFYAALDADSEGVEGKFYVWTQAELQAALGSDFEWFAQLYNISADGNWEHGMNHLHLTESPAETAKKCNIWHSDFDQQYQNALQKLLEIRMPRVRPGLDDKVLASWNGLMLKGLTDAYRAFGDENFKELAVQNAEFIQQKMTIEGAQLMHSYKANQAKPIKGFLEDYAAVIEGYLGLYQVSFNETWLHQAALLLDYVIANFYDPADEFFFFTDQNAEELIARKKEIFDNVIPASNSIMAHNLYTAGLLLNRADWLELSDLLLAKLKNTLLTDSQWVTNWAALATMRAQSTAEVAIVGPAAEALRLELERQFAPNKIMLGTTHSSALPLLQDKPATAETHIYVCFNKTCQLPVKTAAEAFVQINKI
ncbi:MAG: thioredoxin domain-containing protein [Runella slithyformis]|nr:MAG: thioredoxin domain-containing protein [Runella slithyformis]